MSKTEFLKSNTKILTIYIQTDKSYISNTHRPFRNEEHPPVHTKLKLNITFNSYFMAVYYKVVRNLIAKGNNWKIISSPYGKRLCHAIICRFNYIRVQQHFSLKLPQVISLSFTVCLLSIRSHRTSKYNCAFSLNKPCEKFQINCVHISLAISNWKC